MDPMKKRPLARKTCRRVIAPPSDLNSKPSTSDFQVRNSKTTAAPARQNKEIILVKDISNGKEYYRVQVVNGVDTCSTPPDFEYITEREVAPELLDYFKKKSRNKEALIACTLETCKDKCDHRTCPCRISTPHGYTYENRRLPYHEMKDFNNSTMVIKECDDNCICSSRSGKSCGNRVVSRKPRVKIDIFRTEYCGWGVRARENIKAGDYIGEYVGMLSNSVNDGDYIHGLEATHKGNDLTIDAALKGNYTRFLNHSCKPNLFEAKIVFSPEISGFPRLAFFALENIEAYTELTQIRLWSRILAS